MNFIKGKLDYIFTFATEFVILLAGVLVYKFAANLSGSTDFSEYAISRRTLSFILPLLIMGLGVAIPRYVAFSNEDLRKQGSYFISGIILTFLFATPFLIGVNIFKSYFSYLFFGSDKFDFLILSITLMTIGMLLHGFNYSYYRGKVFMIHANVIQIINLGVVPLVVFAFTHNVNDVLFYTGFIWTIISVITTILILTKIEFDIANIKRNMKPLFIYGIWRVPGDFALSGFLAIPAYFAAHMVDDNLITAGYVAFAISLLNMGGAAFAPICLILLPKASIIIKNKDFVLLKHYFIKITLWTLGLTLLGVLFVEVFAEKIILIYLGDDFGDVVYLVQIVILSSFGYTLYISLRSIIDAYYVKAINTKNIIIAFAAFIIIEAIVYYGFSKDVIAMLYCFNGAMIILGILTYYETKKIITKHHLE